MPPAAPAMIAAARRGGEARARRDRHPGGDGADQPRCGDPGRDRRRRRPVQQVLRLARLALAAGADGLVCSPREVAPIRDCLGAGRVLVVPGIRPAGSAAGDQARTATRRRWWRTAPTGSSSAGPSPAAADPAAGGAGDRRRPAGDDRRSRSAASPTRRFDARRRRRARIWSASCSSRPRRAR